MALEHQKPAQPPALKATITLTIEEYQHSLWNAYHLGIEAGEGRNQRLPTCPIHHILFWPEARPTADGSWSYCPICRRDAQAPKTQQTEGIRKIRLAHVKTTELNPRKP